VSVLSQRSLSSWEVTPTSAITALQAVKMQSKVEISQSSDYSLIHPQPPTTMYLHIWGPLYGGQVMCGIAKRKQYPTPPPSHPPTPGGLSPLWVHHTGSSKLPQFCAIKKLKVYGLVLQGKHCNCTDALRRQAFSNVEQALSGDEDISVGSAAADACAISHPIPHGFGGAPPPPPPKKNTPSSLTFHSSRVGYRVSVHPRHRFATLSKVRGTP